MGWLSAIGGVLSAVGSWFGFQGKRQERFNADDVVRNADAKRDQQERERIQKAVEKSDAAGNITEQERREFAED